MEQAIMIAIDLIAVAVVVFGLYFPRHRRRDLVVAYLVVNIGVMSLSAILDQTTVGLGVGLGLFGVLSIIRLRSSEIAQHEVAYYFASLTLGLLAGLSNALGPLVIVLMVLLVAAIFVGDNPALFRRYRLQTVVLDAAYPDEDELKTVLERMLGAKVHRVDVKNLDLVNDTTTVEVRFQVLDGVRAVSNHEVIK